MVVWQDVKLSLLWYHGAWEWYPDLQAHQNRSRGVPLDHSDGSTNTEPIRCATDRQVAVRVLTLPVSAVSFMRSAHLPVESPVGRRFDHRRA